MPFKEKTPEVPDDLVQYEQLEAQKKAIFDKLKNTRNVSKRDKILLVGRVLGYAIEDGLELADTLCLTTEDRISVISENDDFVRKHPDFVLLLRNRLIDYEKWSDDPNLNNLINDLSRMLEVDKSDNIDVLRFNFKAHELSTLSKNILSEIDDYYKNFIRLRAIKEKDSSVDLRSDGEKLGEDVLVMETEVLTPHYYTGPIGRLVGDFEHTALALPLIDEENLDRVLSEAGIIRDEKVEKKIREALYRPLDVIYDLRCREATEKLKKELLASLAARGYKEGEDYELVLDKEASVYEIKSKHTKKHEFNKENCREIPIKSPTFELKFGDPYYEVFFERDSITETTDTINLETKDYFIDGEFYQVASGSDSLSFVIYPNGKRSKIFYGIESLQMTKEGLAFLINDKNAQRTENGNCFQWCVNEKRINIDDTLQTLVGTTILSVNGDIYHVARLSNDIGSGTGYQIMKNSEVLSGLNDSLDQHSLCLINDEVSYTTYVYSPRGALNWKLYVGDKVFGPYNNISVVRDTDSLVFLAEQQNGEKWLHVDGTETRLNFDGEVDKIVKTNSGVFILVKKLQSSRGIHYKYDILDQHGQSIIEYPKDEVRVDSIDNELCYSYNISDDDAYPMHQIYFRGKTYVSKFDGGDIIPIGIIGDDLFYILNDVSRGRRRICSLNSEGVVPISNDAQVEIDNGTLFLKTKESDNVARSFEYAPKIKPTKSELRKLELLCYMDTGSIQDIKSYFEEYYPRESKRSFMDKVRDFIARSKDLAETAAVTLKEFPELFLETVSAKTDDLNGRNIDSFVSSLFPNLRTESKKAAQKARKRQSWGSVPSVRTYLGGDRENNNFLDGDPQEEGIEMFRLREPISEFLSTGVYGKCRKNGSSWEQIGFHISEQHFGPTKEVTIELPISKGMKKAILPKGVNANVIKERVKGIQENGEEIDIEVKLNTLGEARVDIPEGVQKIVYSQSFQELPIIPEDITAEQYAKFRQSCENQYGKEVSESVATLSPELRIFVNSLKSKSPVEAVETIESFVQSIGFYDFDNKEVQSLKEYQNIGEVVSVMSQRMKELKRKDPEKFKTLGDKKYAGVCSDFAKLTTALLREAGFVSGMINGFQPDGIETSVKHTSAHAISYALWPAENGKSKIITLDGTPHGLNEAEELMLGRMRELSLKERRAQFEKEKTKVVVDAEKNLRELEELIARLNPDAIKKLENGKLEGYLNTILGQVRESHLGVIDRLLNASRYAGFNVADIMTKGDVETEIKLRQFLESEISDERKTRVQKADEHFRGEKLLKIIQEFSDSYKKDINVSNKTKALDVIEKIFDISAKYLDPIEARSAIAVITYLRSRRMGI